MSDINKNSNTGCNGFTLVEVSVALSIIMVGIVGAYGLVNQTISASKTASMQLTAAYLGKEGLEIVKNIRDNNYLNIHYNNTGNWDDGLKNCNSGCGADYSMSVLDRDLADLPLRFDGNFFGYDPSGSVTPYKREIKVKNQADHLEITISVTWSERGRDHALKIMENIYDWWPQ